MKKPLVSPNIQRFTEKYFAAIKGLIPSKVVIPAVGLDIGEGSCKMVELEKSGDTFEILNWAVEPIENNDVAGAIRKIFTEKNIQSRSPYTAVLGKGTLIRYIDMPRMPLEDLRKSFELEADKYFPFPADQIYTDCYILDPKGKEKKMSVLVAAAKKEIVNERIELFSKLDLQTGFIGINPIAIANVFHILGTTQGTSVPGVSAVLDMGATVSNLIIMSDSLPRFTRDIYIGGEEFNKRISNVMGVGTSEAEKIKRNPGKKLEEILSACDSVLTHLISEIRLSFDYFITERNVSVSKLYLTGGASSLQGLPEFFTKNLDIPVEQWNPLEAFRLAEGISPEAIQKDVCRLGVALGLALYQYD